MWVFFFKQKTAYEVRISDWSSDVCSSDLFVERAEFPAVQLRARFVEQVAGAGADLEVRGDRFLIEAVRLSGQLEFAVERLVADAEEGAIGDAEAVALRGDGGRFHVDADRARLREAQRRIGEAQFPVAVVGGDDRA